MIPVVAHYTLHEWERRSIGDSPEAIPRNHAELLVATDENLARQRNSANGKRPRSGDDDAEASSSRRALIHWPRELQARERVGQIVAPGVSLEILPKIGGLKGDNEVRRRLVHMLGVAHEIDLLIGERAAHDRQNETLLDVLIRLFAQALLGQVRKGLPRTYISIEEDRAALRGKLNVNRQFSVLAASPQRLACGFDELSYNIPLNQIMATTVRMLRPLARTFETRRLLSELAFTYADISPLPISTLPWDRVQFDRSNRRWKDIFTLARLLVTRFWQNTGAGESQGTALLFDMNKLFESYVARQVIPPQIEGVHL